MKHIIKIHKPMTLDNSRLSERSLREGPALMVYQKSEALHLTNNNEHFQVKLSDRKGLL